MPVSFKLWLLLCFKSVRGSKWMATATLLRFKRLCFAGFSSGCCRPFCHEQHPNQPDPQKSLSMSVTNWTKIFHQLWRVHWLGFVFDPVICLPKGVGHEKTNPGHNKKKMEKKGGGGRAIWFYWGIRSMCSITDRLIDNRGEEGEESEEEGQDLTWVIGPPCIRGHVSWTPLGTKKKKPPNNNNSTNC